MIRDDVERYAEGAELELVLADGFDDCIVGIGRQFTRTFVVYDYEKVIKKLKKRDGMSDEEAVEWFEFNVVGAWVGESTPVFLYKEIG